MNKLMEVRCCCVPKKLLGWLPVPENVVRGQIIAFLYDTLYFDIETGDEPTMFTKQKTVNLPVEKILVPDGINGTYLALKSEENPIEVLRGIPGFKENLK